MFLPESAERVMTEAMDEVHERARMTEVDNDRITNIRSWKSWAAIGLGLAISFFMGPIIGAGIVLGTLVVLGIMMTIERLPGFWRFASTKIGLITIVLGTGFLAHLIVGGSTVTSIVAVGYALVLKTVILIKEREARMHPERGSLLHGLASAWAA